MKSKGVLDKGCRQEIGVLVFRLYVRDVKLSLLEMLSQEVVTHIDVRIRVGHRFSRHPDRTPVVLKNLDARIPEIRQWKTPHGPQEKMPPSSLQPLRPRNPLGGRTPAHDGCT